jgi:L-alanine-DL-glutamate epimerase-like enolase superfamily enzyme
VLACETSDGAHWNAATWIQDGALDMMRTNPNMKGGLTGALKIAHLAESHGMKAQVHGMGVANAHLCGAIPNNDYYEELVISSQQIRGLKNASAYMPIVGGVLTVPEEAGLGYMPDWKLLEKTALAVV